MNILVVDDDEIIRVFLTKVLSRFGAVTTAANGVNGVDVFRHTGGGFDIVFTDRRMPGGMFGEEVVRQIKMLSPRTRVILMSGDDPREVAEVGRAAGADKILFKPIRLEEIEGAVSEALSRQ